VALVAVLRFNWPRLASICFSIIDRTTLPRRRLPKFVPLPRSRREKRFAWRSAGAMSVNHPPARD